jgi:hypothetical protein
MTKFHGLGLNLLFLCLGGLLYHVNCHSNRSGPDQWQLLPQPVTMSAKIRLDLLSLNLADAIQNILAHPEAKKDLNLSGKQMAEVNAALEKYQRELGLAIENNNKLWKRVGGDLSLESANQTALQQYQQQLRRDLQQAFDDDQLEQFDSVWVREANHWIGNVELIVDIPWVEMHQEINDSQRVELGEHYQALLKDFNQEYQELRTRYQIAWLKKLPQSLETRVRNQLFAKTPLEDPIAVEF